MSSSDVVPSTCAIEWAGMVYHCGISDCHAEEPTDLLLHDQHDGHGVLGPHDSRSWRWWRWYGGTGNVLDSRSSTRDLKVPLLHHHHPCYRTVGPLRASLCEDHWYRYWFKLICKAKISCTYSHIVILVIISSCIFQWTKQSVFIICKQRTLLLLSN